MPFPVQGLFLFYLIFEMLRLSSRYAARIGKPDLIPQEKYIKGFFKQMATERTGSLRDKLTTSTLVSYAWRLSAVTARVYGLIITKDKTQKITTVSYSESWKEH